MPRGTPVLLLPSTFSNSSSPRLWGCSPSVLPQQVRFPSLESAAPDRRSCCLVNRGIGRKWGFLAMKTDESTVAYLSGNGADAGGRLRVAAERLINHPATLRSLAFGTSFLKWVASFAAIYLLILDRTNWRTNMLTSLLVPYIFFSLPSVIFNFLRGEVGKWIAFVVVVLRLFFPRHFPECLDMPCSLVLLLVVAPSFFAHTLRDSWPGVVICLLIGCYLLQEHIRASGGFRNSFTQPHGVSNTAGIILLLVYPLWTLVVDIV